MRFLFSKYLDGKRVFKIGTVAKGFLKGATVTEVTDFVNPEPDACSSESGLREMIVKTTIITFQTENIRVACFGTGRETFSPGLRRNWINKLIYALIYHMLNEILY